MSEKWQELYFEALTLDPDFNLVIPIDALPGETEEDTAYRYFREQGVIEGTDEANLVVNLERAFEVDYSIGKFFEATRLAEVAGVLEKLEADGYVYSSVDGNGEMIYGLTKEGHRHLEALQSEDN